MDLPTITGQVLLLCSLAVLGLLAARLLRLPFALACVVLGFGFGQLLPWLQLDTGIRASNFSDLIFYLLLPPLIFEAGWMLEPAQLRRWAPQILSLAIIGLLVATTVGAAALYLGINHPTGFPIIAALVTACLLAPTDPGTVINQLRTNQAPHELEVVMEGESLFNDATAVVLFAVLLDFALGADSGPSPILAAVLDFGIKFGGGLVAGMLSGAALAGLLRIAGEGAPRQLVLLLGIFGTFYWTEHLMHVSGVMAVLACALVARPLSRITESDHVATEDTLAWLGLLCTALLFTLMGLAFEPDMVRERWLAMLLGVGAALGARIIAVYVCLALAKVAGGNHLPFRYAPLVVGGGLRGAVTIALALSLPVALDYWWTAQAIAFGVVLVNLFIQAPLNGWLLKRQISPARH